MFTNPVHLDAKPANPTIGQPVIGKWTINLLFVLAIDVYPPHAGPVQAVEMVDRNLPQEQPVRTFLVSQQFFETLRIPVREGRV